MKRKLLYIVMLAAASFSHAAPFDFPELNENYPLFSQLYSDVQVGNGTASGAGFGEAIECINAAYAYLHPQSPHRYDAAYLTRLRVLLDARISYWQNGESLTDMSGTFGTTYAYMLLKHYRPSDISDKQAAWEDGINQMCAANLQDTALYDDHLVSCLWLNGDIRLALGIYCGGIALSNTTYETKAQQAIDQVMAKAFIGDGATYYVGYNNEVPAYHDESIRDFLWWWTITGSSAVKAGLDTGVPYIPLSVEPGGFQEQSTAIAYKHMYNGIRGLGSSLAMAYLYGDRYNYYFGSQVENSLNSGYAILYAANYRAGLDAVTPPSDFILYDRAIMGPRGRWADWAFVATGRNPQTPEPESEDEGFDGAMGGKNTFVGALALGEWDNNTPLKAAFDGVCPEFKKNVGVSTDLGRSGYEGIYRFLSQDEETATITRDTFGTLATSYRLSERFSADQSVDWGAGTVWLGEQLWLLTGDRVVGLVQIHNDDDADVYGLDTRVVLVGGRKNILGQYHDLVQVVSNEYDFGELSLRINEDNFGGTHTIQRGSMAGQGGDNYTAVLRLHDSADQADDSLIHYPAGTRRWAVVECIRDGRSFADSAVNVMSGDDNIAVLEVRESSGRRFRLIQNLTGASRTYNGNMFVGGAASMTLHKSWTNTVESLVVGSPVAISVQLPAYGHAVAVSSSDDSDHTGNVKYYEDVFTNGFLAEAYAQEVAVSENVAAALTLSGYTASGNELVYTVVDFPNHGTLSGTAPDLVYTPDAGFTGIDPFTFTVSNGGEESDPAVVMLNVIESLNGVWYPLGGDVDRTFSGLSQTGYTLLYHDQSDNRGDVGAFTDFDAPVTLDAVSNQTLSFSFKIDDLTTSTGANNMFRVGFVNNDSDSTYDATVHFVFGYGAPGDKFDVRFAGASGNSNPFSYGIAQDSGSLTGANALFTGNSSSMKVSLTYLEDNGDGTHDYRATILWDGQTHTSGTIIRNTATWDGAYILINNSMFQIAGDGYAISETAVVSGVPSVMESDYGNWSKTHGLIERGFESDPDLDGVQNLSEYALGGDPTVFASQALFPPEISIDGTNAVFVYPRRKYHQQLGLSYVVESCSDLVSNEWNTSVGIETAESLGNEFERVAHQVSFAGEINEFYRVRVHQL